MQKDEIETRQMQMGQNANETNAIITKCIYSILTNGQNTNETKCKWDKMQM